MKSGKQNTRVSNRERVVGGPTYGGGGIPWQAKLDVDPRVELAGNEDSSLFSLSPCVTSRMNRPIARGKNKKHVHVCLVFFSAVVKNTFENEGKSWDAV